MKWNESHRSYIYLSCIFMNYIKANRIEPELRVDIVDEIISSIQSDPDS